MLMCVYATSTNHIHPSSRSHVMSGYFDPRTRRQNVTTNILYQDNSIRKTAVPSNTYYMTISILWKKQLDGLKADGVGIREHFAGQTRSQTDSVVNLRSILTDVVGTSGLQTPIGLILTAYWLSCSR